MCCGSAQTKLASKLFFDQHQAEIQRLTREAIQSISAKIIAVNNNP
jgi:hypothetical protein